jgi:hypothetical protein
VVLRRGHGRVVIMVAKLRRANLGVGVIVPPLEGLKRATVTVSESNGNSVREQKSNGYDAREKRVNFSQSKHFVCARSRMFRIFQYIG